MAIVAVAAVIIVTRLWLTRLGWALTMLALAGCIILASLLFRGGSRG